MSSGSSPIERWRETLPAWGIPQEIIDRAPESPWVHPPAMFVAEPTDRILATPSLRAARVALADSGTVLDVGCGGGRSSVALAAAATSITGIDDNPAMLANFAAACDAAGVAHREIAGAWPSISGGVETHDVVVCHHVVYNVVDIEPFVVALADHARRRVVVELSERHPTTPFSRLWKHFWNIDRPTEPSADLFVAVVRSLGYAPTVERLTRPPRKPTIERADYIAFVRRRLCLTPDRDGEIAAVLGDLTDFADESIVTVFWPAIAR